VDLRVHEIGSVFDGFDEERVERLLEDRWRLDAHLAAVHANCPPHSFCRKGCACTNLTGTGILHNTDNVICEHGRVEHEVREMLMGAAASDWR
jgi:hypothetical protein